MGDCKQLTFLVSLNVPPASGCGDGELLFSLLTASTDSISHLARDYRLVWAEAHSLLAFAAD